MTQATKTIPAATEETERGRTDADISPAEFRKDVWENTGDGEELALREAKLGAEGDVDDMSDLVANETPETVRRISDPHISDTDRND
ncbi:hypothetical protein [Terrihabitans sp. B22-R8]|uniref:hypothetical protein n=1 Tax=Terrihabitans sp. B22-R8 TaxID=3425128 RepID=UPI00403C801A